MNLLNKNRPEPGPASRLLLFLIEPLLSFCIFFCFQQCSIGTKSNRILVYDNADGYYHESTEAGIEALRKICRDSNMIMDVTSEGESFTAENLEKYEAVVFLNTAGDVLDQKQEKAFENYIHAGGGFAGIHTAIDTEHNWEWYGRLTGAHFKSQLEGEKLLLRVEDSLHPATRFIRDSIIRMDEWFILKDISPDINIILSIDGTTYKNGIMGDFLPVTWYHEFEGGRAFVTSMGHSSSAYEEAFFLQHIAGGLKYVMDKKKTVYEGSHQSWNEQKSKLVQNEFAKTSVLCDLFEPMELDIFPDEKIIFIERGGSIKLFDPLTGITKEAGNLDVFTQQEEGLLGLAIDPEWKTNHWIYLYYTPKKNNDAIRLSRFVFEDNQLQLSSEKVLLNVYTEKGKNYYHAGGCIEFDDQGFLYLSTGDNSSHSGNEYALIDERRGRIAFDAQKSSSNSMDLRGKILRIKPQPDGSYLCPKGNLFVNQDIILPPASEQNIDDPDFLKKIKGSINADVMQQEEQRNTVSSSNHSSQNLNANTASKIKADSIYGRPEIYVMGVRNPFRISIDSKRQVLFWGDVGPDAGMPDSLRGPEGFDEINAAQTAGYYGWPYFIGPNLAYRDYNFDTKEAGAFFNSGQPFNNSPNNTGANRLPPARPALLWYSFSSSKEFPNVANGTRCAMAGPVYYCNQYPSATRFPDRYDQKLFIYDWMRNWILAVALDSAGNYLKMEPLAKNIRFSRPVDMLIDKKGSIWLLEYGTEWYTRNKDACLSRIDYIKGDSTITNEREIPAVQWDFYNANRSFYQAGTIIPYRLLFAEAESENLISPSMDIQYEETEQTISEFKTSFDQLFKMQKKMHRGQILIDKSDCKSCHALDRTVNGPSYFAIASRYFQNKKADSLLSNKILYGGSGNWGERTMVAHPMLSTKDAKDMADWILSQKVQPQKIISTEGRYPFTIPAKSVKKDGLFIFHSSIFDNNGTTHLFRPTLQQVEKSDSCSKQMRTYKRITDSEQSVINEMKSNDFFVLKDIDLHGIRSVDFELEISAKRKHTGGGNLELHLDGLDGPLLGTISIPLANQTGELVNKKIKLQVQSPAWPKNNLFHNLFFVLKSEHKNAKPVLGIDWINFNF